MDAILMHYENQIKIQYKFYFENKKNRVSINEKNYCLYRGAYAATEKASQRAVNIQVAILNKVVAFYQAAEEQISEQEIQLMELQLNYSKLQEETQKLIYWCQLHGVNVYQPMLYSIAELELLIIRRRKFRISEEDVIYEQQAVSNHLKAVLKKPEDPFNTISAILSKEYEEYLADDHKYFETLFHARTKFRYVSQL
ncbi:MAG: hypothetical protein EOP41_10160 [Sphingobacteriaceae bacterium]|nr:MAG: hypothetical protein EOP41_10160 [Sphingobacteriaceae bacterium]